MASGLSRIGDPPVPKLRMPSISGHASVTEFLNAPVLLPSRKGTPASRAGLMNACRRVCGPTAGRSRRGGRPGGRSAQHRSGPAVAHPRPGRSGPRCGSDGHDYHTRSPPGVSRTESAINDRSRSPIRRFLSVASSPRPSKHRTASSGRPARCATGRSWHGPDVVGQPWMRRHAHDAQRDRQVAIAPECAMTGHYPQTSPTFQL